MVILIEHNYSYSDKNCLLLSLGNLCKGKCILKNIRAINIKTWLNKFPKTNEIVTRALNLSTLSYVKG